MTPSALITTLTLVAALVALLVWVGRRGGRRTWVAVGVTLATAALAGAAALLVNPSKGVWVDSLGAVDGKVTFSAPWASGSANGDSFRFTSRAAPDAVFAAFADAYPDAVRSGDESTVAIGDHAFTLTYFPRGSADTGQPYWVLANDRA